MRIIKFFPAFFVFISIILVSTGCEKRSTAHSDFTKADSLTETYLALQDTLLQIWNTMIYDDNRKVKTMRSLLHELDMSNPEKHEDLEGYEERVDDLLDMRYDQKSMADSELVSAYDFASNSLVTELIALAESRPEFAYNTTLQKLVDAIRAADQRVNNYRQEYDDIALRFNRFVERNGQLLDEGIGQDSTVLKPLFQMAAE